MNQSYVTTYDGSLSYQLFDGEGLDRHPSGTIFAKRGSILGKGWDYHSAPVLKAFRPLTKSLQGVDPGTWNPECRRSTISGVPVTVFSSDFFDYALDPAREHVVVRLEYFTKDNSASRRLLIRMDVDYHDDPVWGAIPQSWTITRLNEGAELQWSIAGVIEQAEFGTPVHDDDFVVSFPPGSVVRDQISDCRFVVREDGTRRVFGTEELRTGASFTEIAGTRSDSEGYRTKAWVTLFVCVVMLIVVTTVRMQTRTRS